MKRRIAYLVTGFAFVASLAVGSPSLTSADEHQDRCDELATGISYNLEQGNFEYARWLGELAGRRGCDFGAVR